MSNILICLLTALQLCAAPIPDALHQHLLSGRWLRFHVIAADDTAAMQALKLPVRDAIQSCFRQNCTSDCRSIRAQAEQLLPQLAQAAEAAARAHGFDGPVRVTLRTEPFGSRILGALTVPAGEYPALMVRLGEAQGRNWWGLLDPELSLRLAMVPLSEKDDSALVWDWSFRAFLSALLGIPLPSPEGA